ncbi:BQ2448_1855 [Microbotryum intermedium]|uniref:BQ2448_1855 protein n=1 Tax=Microbotryum intermedium TaxID=269621 RepID=A0A238FEC9_9BASI|nr:BQ2448_1855 [Microbotryum intermedium]
MTVCTTLITGASQGLGLGLVRHLLEVDQTNKIIACVRDKASCDKVLHDLMTKHQSRLMICHMDVAVPESVKVSAAAIESAYFVNPCRQALSEIENGFGKDGIDSLICNAGVASATDATPTKTTGDDLKSSMLVNLYGVINSTICLLPCLRKGHKKHIFVVSSEYGSLHSPCSEKPSSTAYSVSKAAANMWTKKLAAELGPEGFTVVAFHPGTVDTGMTEGGEDPKTAAKKCCDNIILAKPQNGKFLNAQGQEMPW